MDSVQNCKRGDLAMIRGLSGPEYLAIYVDGAWTEPRHVRASVALGMPQSIRPLVVIDPEDRDQVERLVTAYLNQQAVDLDNEQPMTVRELRMRAALREFADPKPPKPDEPTGKWAAVETAAGHEWVRTEEDAEYPWRYVGTGGRLADWNGVCTNLPVTVLHEGKRGAS